MTGVVIEKTATLLGQIVTLGVVIPGASGNALTVAVTNVRPGLTQVPPDWASA